jgi:hypothetical protein
MTDDRYPFHHHSEVDVATDAAGLFALLDDPHRLAGHMEKPTLMMAGATMRIETDAMRGQAVGAPIRLVGKMLGLRLEVDEVVTERDPPRRKAWETRGEPRLLVIGAYRMGFTVAARGNGAHLVVFIDYQLPPRGLGHVLGRLFGRSYAQWCTRRMATDAAAASAGASAA